MVCVYLFGLSLSSAARVVTIFGRSEPFSSWQQACGFCDDNSHMVAVEESVHAWRWESAASYQQALFGGIAVQRRATEARLFSHGFLFRAFSSVCFAFCFYQSGGLTDVAIPNIMPLVWQKSYEIKF